MPNDNGFASQMVPKGYGIDAQHGADPLQEASWEYGFAYEDPVVSVKKAHS